jgi:hypothetical protein
MFIEKTTLIQFDEIGERARIMSVFKGREQKNLLKALDLMLSGDFVALARAVVEMPEGIIEFMAMPVQDIIQDVVQQKMCEKGYAEGGRFKASAKELELLRMRGIPIGPEAAMYPRFRALDGAPPPAGAASPTVAAVPSAS